MRNLLNWLIKPFKQNILVLISVFVFSSIVDAYGFTINESLPKAVFILMHHYVIAYILVLFYGFENRIYRSCYIAIVCLLLIINFIIDFTCNFVFHGTFGVDTAAIIMGTNLDEVQEFMQTFFSLHLIIYISLSIVIFILFLVGLSRIFNSLKSIKWLTIVCLCVLVLSVVVLNIVHTSNWGNVSVTKFYKFASFVHLPDLRKYQRTISLESLSDSSYYDIAIIIGESFSRNHSSLYGYDKETNPKLSTLYNDSLLIVYNHVEAPATNTIPSFKCIMSTYSNSCNDTVKWYECETLMNVFKSIGYKTYWISNQSQKGAFDNVPTKYSELCDSAIFVGNRFKGICKTDYDELLLPPLRELANCRQNGTNNFYIIHMMGSHHYFTYRYPKNFDVFKPEDYIDKENFQRIDFATYDNSILYNDSVVSEIMKIFNNETLVIYFSDHAIDLYETNPHYLGHARENDVLSQKVGKQIPFVIYTSDSFKKKHPDVVDKLIKLRDKYFNTENTIYFLMDLLGVAFRKS